MGDPAARFHLVGHSMGGLVVRYYLRYGGAEPAANGPVTWAGAARVASALLAATPNGGSIPALGAILNGERVGFSYTTLAASVVSRMPSIYQLLPPAGTRPLVDPRGQPLEDDLHDPATWERFGWGPFAPASDDRHAPERAFLVAALERSRAVHAALARPAPTPCPVEVHALGGDCLLTLARAVAGEGPPGSPPRLEARTGREQDLLYEAGDGRVTRASLLATHLPGADDSTSGTGLPEIVRCHMGGADHHGLYAEPGFQSVLLRLLLRTGPDPAREARAPVSVPA
jgi:pimeloyl-ACP methyl ester carboxylesterase